MGSHLAGTQDTRLIFKAKMFTASWMTYQRRRKREKIAAMRIAAKIEAYRKELEEAEKTDEEDIPSEEENGKDFLNICKMENEKIKKK